MRFSNLTDIRTQLFTGIVFCFSEHISMKAKTDLCKVIKNQGGTVVYMLNKNVDYLIAVVDDIEGKKYSSKINAARYESRNSDKQLNFLQEAHSKWFKIASCQ